MSVSHQISRLRQKPAGLFSILVWIVALIFVSHASPIAANSQCWIGQIRLIQGSANGIYPLGPYPDRDAILAAAKSKLDDLLLGQPYNDSCYPINPPLPITSTDMTCDWIGCDGESCNSRTGICTPWISDRHIGASNGVGSCGLGYLHTYNDKLNANPSPACAGSYTVRLSPGNNASETASILTSIEPDKATNLVAKVYDQNNQLVPNIGVQITLEAEENSGGHHHGDATVAARTGMLAGQQVLTGNTGPNGQGFSFTYNAPGVSGDIDILATCTGGKNCTQEGPDTVWVGIKGLEPIIPASDPGSGPLYVLIGQDNYHPDNHYLTTQANGRLQQLAALYRQRFPSDLPLHLNDASLERGGLFDIYYDYLDKYGVRHERNAEGWWTTPHIEHRKGTVIDIRANDAAGTIPPINRAKFVELVFLINGYVGQPHSKGTSNQHYHVCLMGVCE